MLLVMMLGLLFLAAAAYFLGDAVTAPARERQTSMRRAARYGTFRPSLGRVHLPFKQRVLMPAGDRLARWTLKLHPKTTIDGVSTRLLAAGLGRSLSATTFLALKSAFAIGETRQDALKKLAERTGTPELSSFVRAIIQADQLGISLGRILRVQATDSRNKRQAAAEEKAMKAPIKMLFPTVLFIFPAMFLVILGPAFLNLSKVF